MNFYHNHRKDFLLVITSLLLLAAIPITVFTLLQTRGYQSQAAGSATLYLSPGSGTFSPSTNYSFAVKVNTGGEHINAVQADFTYDASRLDFVSINTSPAFEIEAPSSGGGGSVSINRATMTPKSGDQIVAYVVFSPKAFSGTTSISFAGSSVVLKSSNNTNILTSTVGANLTVTELRPVYRFRNVKKWNYFFTINESERGAIMGSPDWVYEGVGFYAYPTSSCTGRSPVHRFWNGSSRRHFFTISDAEKNNLIANHSNIWTYEGSAFCANNTQVGGTLPVYRFRSDQLQSHIFTISEAERTNLINSSGLWIAEGIAFYAVSSSPTSLVSLPVYRFFSHQQQTHFYTLSEDERSILTSNPASTWVAEGIAFNAYNTSCTNNTSPVYRFWSDVTKSHLFTINESEKHHIFANYPSSYWRMEGVAFCAFTTQAAGTSPVYRFRNKVRGNYFLTISESEKNALVGSSGVWVLEGTAFFAVP
jgi:hypothetical protein